MSDHNGSSKGKIIALIIIGFILLSGGAYAFILMNMLKNRAQVTATQSTAVIETTAAPTTTAAETTTEATTTTSEETTTESSDEKTLEEIADPAILQEDVDKTKAKDSFKKTFKDIKLEISGNTIIHKYYYKQVFSAGQKESIKQSLESSGMKDKLESFKDTYAKKLGKRPEKVAIIYYNGDGTEILTIEG